MTIIDIDNQHDPSKNFFSPRQALLTLEVGSHNITLSLPHYSGHPLDMLLFLNIFSSDLGTIFHE